MAPRAAFVDAGTTGAGYSVYADAMLIMVVTRGDHGLVVHALLPQLSDHAVDGDLPLVRERLADAIRMCLAVIVPVAALLAALSVRSCGCFRPRGCHGRHR